ncbi:hypothetical protein [Reyranella sp.]|uniref:hypothetical protein n=1 Tax=Reyranella sp. TaxID=1929291 RepID=UPI003BAB50DC
MTTDPAAASLSTAETAALREIAGAMIPASAEHGVPGADDPAIQDDILRTLGRDLPLVREALAAIAARAPGGLSPLDDGQREALLNDYQASGGAPAAALGRVVLAAYYRDDRVLLALKHEARAPFPGGYVLEQGDWSLLDAVRQRPPLWRDDRREAGR